LFTSLRYAGSLPNDSDLTELDQLKRRSFITLLGGLAAWPLAASAQQPERMRRVAVLMGLAESDPEGQKRIKGLRSRLNELGWTENRNLRLDCRWQQVTLLAREHSPRNWCTQCLRSS
jgi:hypothetical protein